MIAPPLQRARRRRRWRRWRRRRRRWWRRWWRRWPRRRDLVVEDVLLAGAADQDPAVRPRRVHGAVDRRVRAVVVARVAGLDASGPAAAACGKMTSRDRGCALPGQRRCRSTAARSAAGRRSPCCAGRTSSRTRGLRRHAQRGLPLAARAAVLVEPQRSAPGGAVVGRADVVDVALVGARAVLRRRRSGRCSRARHRCRPSPCAASRRGYMAAK